MNDFPRRSGYFSKIAGVGRRLFQIAAAITVISAMAAGFYFYRYFSTEREIALSLTSPRSAMLGEPFELGINFSNNSKNPLKNATLSVFLPEETVILEQDINKRVVSYRLGDLETGTFLERKIPMMIFGGKQTIKKIGVSVSYSSLLSARFEKTEEAEIAVYESGIGLDLTVPERVLNNEEFEILVNYSNVSGVDFSDAEINLIFPKNFTLKKSEPALKNGVFEIGNLIKGKSGAISILGTMIGPEESFFEIKARAKISYGGNRYLINEKAANLNIAASPISLRIILDKTADFVFPGDFLKYQLVYQNKSDVGLSDIVVKAKLIGEMFDFSKLKTGGAFNSRSNTLTWGVSSVPELRLLPPDSMGQVEFEIPVKSGYPIKRLSDKNFVLKAEAEISSPTVPYYVAADKTVSLAKLETKVAGQIEIESKIYFRDPETGLIGKGSLPPRVNQPINFIVYWVVRNYATDVKDISIKSFLEPGVSFVKVVKSNVSTQPAYNERTQEISWSIDRILAAKGIIGNPVEAVFQIEALPNITQIGKEMPLMKETIISAVDEFVDVGLNNVFGGLTSKSLKDSGFDVKMGEVTQ